MRKKTILIVGIVSLFFNTVTIAQGIVNVNTLIGTANAVIPVYTVQSGGVSLPVSVAYNGSGVKTRDVESTAGMNWNLIAGGQVSRLVRGLPDDCYNDVGGHRILGWMDTLNYGASYASGYTVQNDNNPATCSTDETNDITNINNNVSYSNDTEPDMFYVNAPGLSCQMVWDRTARKFGLVNYQDLLISYAVTGGSGNNRDNITSFTITNDKGITYTFAAPDSVAQTTVLGTGGTAAYFQTLYNQYQYGVKYADTWSLTSMKDAVGNSIVLTYTKALPRTGVDPVILYIGGSTTASRQYNVVQEVRPRTLATIANANVNTTTPINVLNFTWIACDFMAASGGTSGTGQTVISTIQLANSPLTYTFNYSAVQYASSYVRYFLRNFTDGSCNSRVNYTFGYLGETLVSPGTYTTTLPDSLSNQVDYWGYYAGSGTGSNLIPTVCVLNPSSPPYPQYVINEYPTPVAPYDTYVLNNSNRAGSLSASTGSLVSITYAQGGNTIIGYETATYHDVPTNTDVYGGGIRVTQVTDADNINTSNNITRSYTYNDPSTGFSSGKPVSLPQFAFTIPYSGSATGLALWKAATALSANDLSTDDHTVMYEYVRVSKTSAGSTLNGSTLYNFYVPATQWDASAHPACNGCSAPEWYPTFNYLARYTCSSNYGPITGYHYIYPFIPNPNYDFERGLPLKTTNFNNAGTEVSESTYSYIRSYTPTPIVAFKFDDMGATPLKAKLYNQYTVFYNTSELTATVTNKVFDLPALTTAQTSKVNYFYASANHKLLTQQQSTNSDGSTLNTYISYIKDFAPTNGSNSEIKALYFLKQENINAPVETYQTVTPFGGSPLTVSASLTLFSPYTVHSVTNYLPFQQLKMVIPGGGTFTPFTINTTSQTIAHDGKYIPVANYDVYDNTGIPVTVDDNYKNFQATVMDHLTNHPTAVFKNAAFNQIAFGDFDTQASLPQNYFTVSGTTIKVPGHAGMGLSFTTMQTAWSNNVLVKNGAAIFYIFSIWMNPGGATGTLSVAVTGLTTAATIPYSGTGWKYYEIKIPASSFSSTYQVKLNTDHNIAIDDILFYPDLAEVTTASYDPVTHFKTSETNTNGVSTYFTGDQWGRPLLQFDQDKNIVSKTSYFTQANVQSFTSPVIDYSPIPGVITTTTPVTFTSSLPDPCSNVGLTFHWSFGDGDTVTTVSNVSPAHTYTSPGSYLVNLTVNSPFLGSKSASPPTSITVVQATATVTSTTHPFGAGIDSLVFTGPNNYTFTGPILPGHVNPGNYIITIYPNGGPYNPSTGKGYTNIVFSDGATGVCFNYTGGHFTFSWTVVADHTLDFSFYNNNYCPYP